MPLPSSPNTLHFGGLADNNESASKDSISLQAYSRIFSEGSKVGDVDGDGTGDQPADRTLLNTAPYALSKFYDAHIPNDQFGSVVSKLVDGTDVSSNGYVDGEAGRIYWTITEDPAGSTTYTGGLKYKSDASVAASSTLAFDGTGTKYVTITAPSTTQQIGAPYKYYSFVSTAEFKNAVGADLSHYDQLSGGSVNSSATSHTLDASSETNPLTIAPVVSVGTQASYSTSTSVITVGDNQGISIAGANVTMTGAGVTQITVTHIGNPSQARNSTTSTENITVTYNRAIESLTLVTSDTVNYGGNNVTISAISEGVQQNNFHVGYDDNNTPGDTSFTSLYDNVTSLYVRTTVSKTFTAPAGSYYIKAMHTGDGSAVIGASLIVAPTFVYSTIGNSANISVNGTSHRFYVTSATGNNIAITISNNLNATTTTEYSTGYTLAPGTADGIYTVTYTGTANYSQTNNQTDTVNVYPDANYTINSGDTTLLINSPAGAGLTDDNLQLNATTSVGDNISAYYYVVTKDTAFLDSSLNKTYTDAITTIAASTLESAWGPGQYNTSLRVTGGGGLQNTQTDNDSFTIADHPPQALTVTTPNGNILRRGSAFTIHWSKTSAVYVNLKLYRDVLLNGSYIFDRNIDVAGTNTGTSYSWTVPGDATLVNDRYKVYGYVYNGTATDFSPIFSIRDGIATAPSTPSDSSGNETAGISWSDGSYNAGGNKVYTYSDSAGDSQYAVSSTIAGTSYTYSEGRTSTTVTRYFKVSGINLSGEEGDKSGVSGGANIYPILSEEFQAADISFSVDPVEVGVATELRIANVADNIVGYTWAESGDGGMSVTSGTASTGDTNGTSDDSTGLINESNITVTFDTAEQDKTISLTLYGRNNQYVTRTKDIDVELVDALTISGISNTNGTNSITVSGNQSGFQYGVTVGYATNASPASFVDSTEEATNPDSRFTLRSYSESFTPADQVTTQYLVGRVVADTDGDALNTSPFYYYPKLKAGRNQITPSSATITTAQSVSFGTPQTATDNVTKYVYSTNSHCSITNSTQGDGSSVISHTTAVLTSSSVGTKTINLTVSGLSGQNNISGGTATITVNYAPEVTLVSVTGATPTWYTTTSLTVNTGWQGFALNTVADNLQIKLFNSSNNQVGSTQTIYGNSIGQGSAGGTANYNHTWGTISGVATGYYFKSIAFDDENQASYEDTSATFDIDGVSSYTVFGQEIFWNAGIIGYDTLISAADTTADGSNTNITETLYAITGTLADGVVLYYDEDLESAHKFNGNYKYFKAGSYCFKIKGDTNPRGEIDDIRSIVPNTLATPTAAADGETDIDLTIPSSNTEVARSIRVHSTVPIGGNSTATWTVTQSPSYSTTKSMAAIFGTALAAGTSYTFKVQGYNNEQTGPYSYPVTVSTDTPVANPTVSIAGDNSTGKWNAGTNTYSDQTLLDGETIVTTTFTVTSDDRDGNIVRLQVAGTNDGYFKWRDSTSDSGWGGAGWTYVGSSTSAENLMADNDTNYFRISREMNSGGDDSPDLTLRCRVIKGGTSYYSNTITINFDLIVM